MTEDEAKLALDAEIKAARARYQSRLARIRAHELKEAKLAAAALVAAQGFRRKPRPSDHLREKAHAMRNGGASYAEIARAIGKSRSYIPLLLKKQALTEADLEPKAWVLSARAHSALHRALRALAPAEYPEGHWRPSTQELLDPALVARVFNPTKSSRSRSGFDGPYYGLGEKTLLEINAWLVFHGHDPKRLT